MLKRHALMHELGSFTLVFVLSKPRQVPDIKFSKEKRRLDLRIDFVKGAKFLCPACQENKKGEVHDTLDRIRQQPASSNVKRICMRGCRGSDSDPPGCKQANLPSTIIFFATGI